MALRLRVVALPTLMMRSHWAASVVVLVAWLAVDVVAAASNDAIWVLDHAYAPRASGLVEIGYRFLGYPLYARFMIEAGRVVGLDPLFAIVLGQRLLALLVGLLLARLYRWWGVVIFVTAFSVTTLVQMDYILAESLAVSLAAIAAVAFARFWFQSVDRLRWLAVVCLSVLWLGLMRAQYAILLVIPGVALLDLLWPVLRRRRFDQFPVKAAAMVIALGITLGSFNLLVGAENRRELGDVDASAETYSSVEYLSAWRTVFQLEGIAPDTPELLEFYAEGSPWPSWRLVRIENDRSDWPREFGVATDRLLQASGLNVTTMRIKSVLWGLIGGRFDDMSAIKERVMSPSLTVRLSSTYGSANVKRIGEQVFLDEYNDGLVPAALITSPIVPWFPVLPKYLLGIAWAALTVIGAFVIAGGWRGRVFIVASAVPHIGIALVGATFLGDGYRWLLPTLLFSFVAIGAGICESALRSVDPGAGPGRVATDLPEPTRV